MSLSPNEISELQYLIDLALADDLTPPQRDRLNDLLRTGESALQIYADQLAMQSALAFRSASAPFSTPGQSVKGVPDPPTSKKLPVLNLSSRPALSRNPAMLASILIVALGFYGTFTLLSWNLRSGSLPQDVAQSPPRQPLDSTGVATKTAAVVIAQQKAEFAGDSTSLAVGHSFRPGDNIELRSGLIEVAFADGAHVVVEGPARLTIDSSMQGRLNLGKLVANVPPPAIGFTIETPTARIVDLGTEFAAEVGDDGNSGVHVLSGLVSVTSSANKSSASAAPAPLRLTAGQSVSVLHGKGLTSTVASPATASRFVRTLTAPVLSLPRIHFLPSQGANPFTGVRLRLSPGSSLETEGITYDDSQPAGGALRVTNASKVFLDLDCSDRGTFAAAGLVEKGKLGRDGTTLYVSWLARCERPVEAAYAGVSFMLFGDTGMSSDERLFVGKPFKAASFGADLLDGKPVILDGNAIVEDVQPVPLDQETHRFVVRMRFLPGADEVAVFIDPPGDEQAAIPGAALSADVAFDRLRFSVGDDTENPDGACWWFDELRFGVDWQAVTSNE